VRYQDLDRALIRRHDRRGPRYTSYPTAPHFRAPFGGAELEALIAAGEAEDPPPGLSIYVHVPYCRSRCLYCGCNTEVCDEPAMLAEYTDCVVREIGQVLPAVDRGRRIEQLHLGGGTPGLLDRRQIGAVLGALTLEHDLAEDAEVSIELDPRTLQPDTLPGLRELGFNRLSFGVQDLDPEVQQAVARVQPEALVRDALQQARELGFDSVNLDLIYGLPHQTAARFADTVGRVLAWQPDRVALFNFAFLPERLPHQAALPAAQLPDPGEKLAIFLQTADAFVDAGYRFLGLDHFARPDDELSRALDAGALHRNFQGYTARAGLEVLAFGASGISQLRTGFAQNMRDSERYRAAVDRGESPVVRGLRLTRDDRIRGAAIEALMCNLRLDLRALEQAFEIRFDSYFPDVRGALAPLQEDGLVRWEADALVITEVGRLLMRNVAMAFDAYLAPDAGDGPGYSRTV